MTPKGDFRQYLRKAELVNYIAHSIIEILTCNMNVERQGTSEMSIIAG